MISSMERRVSPLESLIGRRVTVPGHFVDAVTIEDARPLGSAAELRVRLATGELDEAVLFLIVPAALPESPAPTTASAGGASASETGRYPEPSGTGTVRDRPDASDDRKPFPADKPGELTISFTADRDKLFNAWNALANLVDVAGRVSVSVKATSHTAFDRARLENGVLEPLRELALIDDSET